jgi:hypothetical protein
MSKMIPSNAKRIPLRPLAFGEKTGHHHSLMADPGVCLEDVAEMFEVQTDDGVKHFLRINGEGVSAVDGDGSGISLVHQEHKAHPSIAPGSYEVVIQQENTDWGSRAVLD